MESELGKMSHVPQTLTDSERITDTLMVRWELALSFNGELEFVRIEFVQIHISHWLLAKKLLKNNTTMMFVSREGLVV
jgi:hypothetical protein